MACAPRRLRSRIRCRACPDGVRAPCASRRRCHVALGNPRVLRHPERAQRALLRRILAATKGSAVARALDLSGVESFAEFLELRPRPYSFYVPFVDQTLDGVGRLDRPVVATSSRPGVKLGHRRGAYPVARAPSPCCSCRQLGNLRANRRPAGAWVSRPDADHPGYIAGPTRRASFRGSWRRPAPTT